MTEAAESAAALLSRLRTRGWSLAVAESLTGGALSAAVVDVPRASEVFRGAVVAYATPVKAELLGVDAVLLAERGPVDADVARQMALGVREALAVDGRVADMGVSTTGVAGPAPQSGQPVGTVHVGVSTARVTTSRVFLFAGGRSSIRRASVLAALRLAAEVLATEEEPREYGSSPRS